MTLAALEIAIQYKLKKKAIYAKEGDEKVSTNEAEKIKQHKITSLHKQYNPEIRPGQLVTFSGRVVNKEEHERELSMMRKSTSQKSMLPSLSKSALSRSQANVRTIKPNLKGLNPKNTVFLTNNDGSVISVENLSKLWFYKNMMISTRRFSGRVSSTCVCRTEEFSRPR